MTIKTTSFEWLISDEYDSAVLYFTFEDLYEGVIVSILTGNEVWNKQASIMIRDGCAELSGQIRFDHNNHSPIYDIRLTEMGFTYISMLLL